MLDGLMDTHTRVVALQKIEGWGNLTELEDIFSFRDRLVSRDNISNDVVFVFLETHVPIKKTKFSISGEIYVPRDSMEVLRQFSEDIQQALSLPVLYREDFDEDFLSL